MPKVKIPPVLLARRRWGGARRGRGRAIVACSARSMDRHPDVEAQLFDGGGNLNRYVNVYRNDEDVRVLDGPRNPVLVRTRVVI